jgi:hypothetical protein
MGNGDSREQLGDGRYGAIPISYTIDADNGLVLSVGRGVVTTRELFAYLDTQARDPAVPLPLRDLHDLSGVDRFEVGADDLRQIVDGLEQDPQRIRDGRLAIIAPRDHIYGMYRMFELLSENAPPFEQLRQQGHAPEVRVFREQGEARDWLISDESEASPRAPHS